MRETGIVGAGVAVPASRLPLAAIHAAWGNQPIAVVERLGVRERAVPDPDADVITLAAEAASRALASSGRERVDAVLLGTQTGPYLTRSAAAIVADMLGLRPNVFAADVQFADKSGSAALLLADAWVRAGNGESVLVIGADTLAHHAAPGDPLEYTAAAGAAAFVVAAEAGALSLQRFASVASDTPDRYRVDGERYLRNGGAVMAAVGAERHAADAFAALAVDPATIDHLVVTQPDLGTPKRLAKRFGCPSESLAAGLVAATIGDAGAASSLLGLARVIERAQADEQVVLVACGAGAGSDAILFRATGAGFDTGIEQALARRIEVDYPTAVRFERRYAGLERPHGSYD